MGICHNCFGAAEVSRVKRIMLRRFIPKGKSISDYTDDEICFFADCINGLPRKILGYHTPEELFDRQLDRIYAA